MSSLKVKRKRTRFHISAPKLKPVEENDLSPLLQSLQPIPSDFMNKLSFVSLAPQESKAGNKTSSLSGVTVESHSEIKNYEEKDKKNIVNDKDDGLSVKKQMKKKDKRKLRHEKWMEKIQATHKAKEMAKAALKRKRTVIVGDMQPLLSSLPEIEEKVLPSIDVQSLNKKKKRKKGDISSRLNSVYKERELFQQVLAHPSYQKDPLGTISVHIQNTAALNRI